MFNIIKFGGVIILRNSHPGIDSIDENKPVHWQREFPWKGRNDPRETWHVDDYSVVAHPPKDEILPTHDQVVSQT